MLEFNYEMLRIYRTHCRVSLVGDTYVDMAWLLSV
jgi:hypothetical protein